MPNWRLTLDDLSAPGEPVRHSLVVAEGERCTFGRSREATMRFETGACSRIHCFITVEGGVAFLEDAGSSNGTWLNGKKVKRNKIVAGDKFAAGQPLVQLVAIEPLD